MANLAIQLTLLLAVLACLASCHASGTDTAATPGPMTTEHGHMSSVVEAACGQCQFDLPGTGCDLAVRIDGQAYFVDGTGIDEHGDAHAADGFCNAVRRARVTGEVVDGRFAARSFELLPSHGE